MAKTARTLDTPFRPGERVIAATDLADITSGTKGKVQLANGLGPWRRYWVTFDGGRVRGQVPHDVLARPGQLDDWTKAREAKAQAALNKGKAAAAGQTAADVQEKAAKVRRPRKRPEPAPQVDGWSSTTSESSTR